MSPLCVFLVIGIVGILVVANAVSDNAARLRFEEKWQAHDIHWDSALRSWRHESTCTCKRGAYSIGPSTEPRPGVQG